MDDTGRCMPFSLPPENESVRLSVHNAKTGHKNLHLPSIVVDQASAAACTNWWFDSTFHHDAGRCSQMSDRVPKTSYSLSCDELRLCVEFSLSPGVYGRIGSSPDMELSLPLVGLADEECRIDMDESGLLWLTRAADETPIRLDPPAYFHAGPYRFLMREMPPSDASASGVGILAPEAYQRNRRYFALSRRDGAAVAATVGLAVLAGAFWLATRSTDETPPGGKTTALAPEAAQPTPAPPVPTPEEVAKEVEPAGQVAKREELLPELQVAKENSPTLRPEPERIDLEELATKVAPCVFLIQVADANGTKVGTGTGFSVSRDGLVATNYHVVEAGQTFSIVTNQGARFEDARVIIEDPATDLALLKIDGKGLPFLTLAETSDVPVGKRVAALGSPEGLAGSLSEGIVSAPPRNLSEKFPDRALPNRGVLIQTTADISPGSSGSPLFDGEGRVLGVMTMIFRGQGDAQNLNFAVPVEALIPLLSKPKEEWLDIRLKPVDSTSNTPGGDASAFTPPDDVEVFALSEKMEALEWLDSMKIASRLTEKYPDSAYAHFNHGYCASKLRLDKQAEISYRKVVEIAPTDYDTWNNLGVVLRNQRLLPESLMALEKSVSLQPDNAMAWDNLVLTNVLMENWPKATTALETLSRLDMENAKETARLLSRLRITNQTFRQALADALSKKGTRTAGDGPPVFMVIGVAPNDVLSVRSGPGSNFAKLDGIANGNEVFVVGEPKMNGGTEWLPIEYGNFSGWVASKFLTAAE